MVRSKVIERREELSFRQIARSSKDHNGARVGRLRNRTCFHINQFTGYLSTRPPNLLRNGQQRAGLGRVSTSWTSSVLSYLRDSRRHRPPGGHCREAS